MSAVSGSNSSLFPVSDGTVQFHCEENVQSAPHRVEQSDPEEMFNLGLCHETGKGVPTDEILAAQLYQQAAERGTRLPWANLAFAMQEAKELL